MSSVLVVSVGVGNAEGREGEWGLTLYHCVFYAVVYSHTRLHCLPLQMTQEEHARKDVRRAQNRGAARRFRLRKKQNETEMKKVSSD